MSKKKKNKAKVVPEVVLVSDPNADVDDLLSFVMAAALADKGEIIWRGVMTTAGEPIIRLRRAHFAKGALIELGYPFLTVCVGREYERCCEDDNFYFEAPEVAALESKSAAVRRNPCAFLHELTAGAVENSLILVVNATMVDVAAYLREIGAKALKKIRQIIIMGGYDTNAEGLVVPDGGSYNYKVNPQAAAEVFERAQTWGIRLVLVPREIVYQVQVSAGFYQELGKRKNLLARAVCAANGGFLEKLWASVRGGRYSHFDIRRFAKVFLGEDYKISERVINAHMSFAEVMPKIKYFNLYDVLTVLLTSEDRMRPFIGYERVAADKNVFVPVIKDVDGLRSEMLNLLSDKLADKKIVLKPRLLTEEK